MALAIGRPTDADPTGAALLGCLQIVDPHALYLSAQSLVDMPPPTVREHLARLTMRRSLLVGSRTEDYNDEADLLAAGVRQLEVPDAGHGMNWENPSGFARAIADALGGAGNGTT